MGGYYVIMADIIRVEHPHPALDEVKKNKKKSYVFGVLRNDVGKV